MKNNKIMSEISFPTEDQLWTLRYDYLNLPNYQLDSVLCTRIMYKGNPKSDFQGNRKIENLSIGRLCRFNSPSTYSSFIFPKLLFSIYSPLIFACEISCYWPSFPLPIQSEVSQIYMYLISFRTWSSRKRGFQCSFVILILFCLIKSGFTRIMNWKSVHIPHDKFFLVSLVGWKIRSTFASIKQAKRFCSIKRKHAPHRCSSKMTRANREKR